MSDFSDQGNFGNSWSGRAQKDFDEKLVGWTEEAFIDCLGIGQQSADHVFRWANQWFGQLNLLPMYQLAKVSGARWSHYHLHHPSAVCPSLRNVWSTVHSKWRSVRLPRKHKAARSVPDNARPWMSVVSQSGQFHHWSQLRRTRWPHEEVSECHREWQTWYSLRSWFWKVEAYKRKKWRSQSSYDWSKLKVNLRKEWKIRRKLERSQQVFVASENRERHSERRW